MNIINNLASLMRRDTTPLPEGYRLCNYIEASGDAYARPAVYPDGNTTVEIDYMSLKDINDPYEIVFGTTAAATGTSANSFYFLLGTSNNAQCGVWKNTGYALVTDRIIQNGERHIYTLSPTSLKIDNVDYGTPYASGTQLNVAVGYRFYLFTRNQKDSPNANMANGRIYSFKVYQSGVLTYDYRPVVSNDGTVAGFYNILLQGSGSVAASASETPFTYG